MAYRAHVAVTLAPLRAAADDRAELVSELLAGEPVAVEEEGEGPWVAVQAVRDGYRGWCDRKQLAPGVLGSPVQWFEIGTAWIREAGGTPMQLPWGATLNDLGGGRFGLGTSTLVRQGAPPVQRTCAASTAAEWRGVPYRWGGKSQLGVDCSGLVQQVFAALGIALPRDAADQIHCGSPVAPEHRLHGDVAFFQNAAGKVIHVGICQGSAAILHASGEVREDALDTAGIVHAETGNYTHTLCGIRRFVQAR